MRFPKILPFFLLSMALSPAAEIVVYGSTPAGISAAVSAAKAGQDVVLIEPTDRIGGLMTSGLSYSDFRSLESLTGFFLDFMNRVEAHYAEKYGADSAQVKSCFHGAHGEPGVNLLVFEEMLASFPSISVVKNQALDSVTLGEWKLGRRPIVSITARGEKHEAKVFIDASYEGDLMAMAGENYHVGRESREQYGEPMAGDSEGRADGQVQGYNFRLIMTQDPENILMPTAPEGYKREDFVGGLDAFKSNELKKVFASDRSGIYRAHMPLMPNGKSDVNDTPHSPVRLSMPDINDSYPDADRETRAKIVAQHLYYNVGLLYFLQNDKAVPEAIQQDARSWGWCKDEFTETGGIPPQLYIREARRIVGQHVFTAADTRQAPGDARSVLHKDSIAIGDYVHNCHGTGRSGTRFHGEHSGEFYDPIPPYQIPYGVIVPAKTTNLLVPVACSASHFGFGALRLEPIWAALGQAAGWAAHVSLESNLPVQEVEVAGLQKLLHQDRSATIYLSDVTPDSPLFASAQWFGTQGAFKGLAESGQLKLESLGGQYSKAFPGHFAELDKPLTPDLEKAWEALLPDGAAKPEAAVTRGEWLQNAER